MANKKYDEEEGVWRTIGGRRVFIKTGVSLSQAMKDSGKFKRKGYTNEDYQKQENKIAQLNKDYRALETEVGAYDDDEFMSGSPAHDELRWGLRDKEDELREAQSKYREMEKNPYVERKYGVNKQELSNLKHPKGLKTYDSVDDVINDPNSALNRYINEKEVRTTKQVNDEYNALSKKMQQDDYYYKAEDDRKLKKLRAEYDTLIAKGQEDVNLTEYNKKEKTPYNSKAYAKLLSQSYMAEEDYEDKITPKYIQDIDAGRYGNMSDEEAIKNWIDGGADIIYNDDAERQLKEWGIPVKNDDAYGTYKSELAKQLLPIYERDKSKTMLSKMGLGDLREIAKDYNLEPKGLSRNELIEKLLVIFDKR